MTINIEKLPHIYRPTNHTCHPDNDAIIDLVIHAMENRHDISHETFIGRSRRSEIIWPRAVAMFLSRDLTSATLQAIADKFGGRNYGTVMHACQAVQDRCDTEPNFKEKVQQWKKQILAPAFVGYFQNK